MQHLSHEIAKAIKADDFNSVVFVDPFTDATRKAKRNLLVAGFIAILISVLQLEITGFLGLQASNLKLGNALAQGLACSATIYLSLSFCFGAYIDYAAWQFRRERLLIRPYLEFIQNIKNQFRTTEEQIVNAMGQLQRFLLDQDKQTQTDISQKIHSSLGQLTSIDQRLKEITEEVHPLLQVWGDSIRKMNRLTWRLRARFVGLWILDILVPLLVGGLAIVETFQGLQLVISKILH